jgi:ankyrin repeat protein
MRARTMPDGCVSCGNVSGWEGFAMPTKEQRAARPACRLAAELRVIVTCTVLVAAFAGFAWYGVTRRPVERSAYLTSPLVRALHNRDHAAFVRTVSSFGSIDQADDEGVTALMLTVWCGDPAETEYLLARGADPNRCHGRRGTPLVGALAMADLTTAELLLRHGADPGQLTKSGDSALLAAVRSGSLAGVRFVLSRDVMPMPAGIRDNPLNCASAGGEEGLEIVRELLQAGIDPNRPGANGELPLVLATLYRSAGVVAMLRAAGADPDLPDHKGRTARSAAAGDPMLVAALRAQG